MLFHPAVYKDMTDNLNLPPFELKISEQASKTTVWDPVRRVWVAFTSEERVRQAFVSYLINYKGFLHHLMLYWLFRPRHFDGKGTKNQEHDKENSLLFYLDRENL